jgi:hypothetical protein
MKRTAAKSTRSKSKKRTWTTTQRMNFKLTVNKRRLEKAQAKLAGERTVDLTAPSSLTHTPTRLTPRFKSQVPDIDSIYHRWQKLGPSARRFMLAELMRYQAMHHDVTELQ